MKRTISLLSALAFVLAFSGSAFAQEVQDDIAVTANVQADLTLVKNNDVEFATIEQGGAPILDPQDTNTDDVGNGAALGVLKATASTGTQLIINWDASATLGNTTDSETLTFTPDISANSSNNAGSSTDVTEGTANAATETDGSSGELFIFIGGDLGTVGSSQTTGSYSTANGNGSGSFSVTVNYQ
jgi:hypothetical protein